MSVNDELGTRMKTFYEAIPKTKLMRRTPVAIRIDGKAFHTFTRGFQKPFDEVLVKSMQETMKYLCENIQGCVLGFTQSDEITLILVDYKKLNSSAWFDYEVQKMCSIAASMATMAFNKAFNGNVMEYILSDESLQAIEVGFPKMPCAINDYYTATDSEKDYIQTLLKAVEKGAMFDARCFSIPKEEVANLLYWRQVDAARNSVQMVARAKFSHNECDNKNQSQLQEMLFQTYGINWNDFPTHLKRGSCCIKSDVSVTFANEHEDGSVTTGAVERPHWEIDLEIPIFKGEGRQYINKRILYDDGTPEPIVIY